MSIKYFSAKGKFLSSSVWYLISVCCPSTFRKEMNKTHHDRTDLYLHSQKLKSPTKNNYQTNTTKLFDEKQKFYIMMFTFPSFSFSHSSQFHMRFSWYIYQHNSFVQKLISVYPWKLWSKCDTFEPSERERKLLCIPPMVYTWSGVKFKPSSNVVLHQKKMHCI